MRLRFKQAAARYARRRHKRTHKKQAEKAYKLNIKIDCQINQMAVRRELVIDEAAARSAAADKLTPLI